SAASETAEPIVRRATICAGFRPKIPVRFWVTPRSATFPKPIVLVGGVIGDEIENKPYAGIVQSAYDFIEIFQGAEASIDSAKISYVVTKIPIGTSVNRRKPYGANAKPVEIIDALQQAGQIAFAIPVTVLKGYRGDFVHY